MKTVILTNVGTPQSYDPEDVGIYLREFLMDENIVSIPRPFRDLLVKGLIVPRRKFSSAEKYQKIWTEQGSPLLVETLNLQSNLQKQLGSDWKVVIGMQIGKPSLKDVLQEAVRTQSKVVLCPLYPQYANATTGGALKALSQSKLNSEVLSPFYSKPWFLNAQAAIIQKNLEPQDHLLLSYHGLPVSQLKDHDKACGTAGCCEAANACEKNCYKAQCLKTTKLLQNKLSLSAERIHIGFQSRLGRAKWIEPSTENVIQFLLQQGVRHLKVACPSFVSDCLETLEEIGMEMKQIFLSGGGKNFQLLPCVNSHEIFVQGLSEEIQKMGQN